MLNLLIYLLVVWHYVAEGQLITLAFQTAATPLWWLSVVCLILTAFLCICVLFNAAVKDNWSKFGAWITGTVFLMFYSAIELNVYEFIAAGATIEGLVISLVVLVVAYVAQAMMVSSLKKYEK